jgi:hypothetical protein
MHPSLPLSALALLPYLPVVFAGTTLSIQSQPAYTSQRDCVKNCLYCDQYWLQNCDATPLAAVIGCYDDQVDSCYYATDLQSSATSYLTSCIYSGCNGDPTDVSIGVSLYDGYCGIGGATLDNYPTITSTGSGTTLVIFAGSTLSIQSQPAYTSQRDCVKNCLYCGEYWLQNCDATPLAAVIGCYDDQVDSCYCATDLQSSASSYLTECIYSGCSGDPTDVSIGVSLYDGYCGIGGATLDNYPVITSTSMPGSTPTPVPGSAPTAVSATSTQTPSPKSNSLSTGATIGIAVPIGTFAIGFLGFLVKWYYAHRLDRREEAAAVLQQPSTAYYPRYPVAYGK